MIFARKLNKIPEFYMIIAREKNIFPICFFFGGGDVPPCTPVSLRYSAPVSRSDDVHGARNSVTACIRLSARMDSDVRRSRRKCLASRRETHAQSGMYADTSTRSS